MRSLYLIGSLRNPQIPTIGNKLRGIGYDVFDDWFAAGERADDCWQAYENQRGRTLTEALQGYAARHVFAFDKYHLDRCSLGVLVLPAGKSGHLELGYLIGRSKPAYILCPEEPERYDVMYQFATKVFTSVEEMLEELYVR